MKLRSAATGARLASTLSRLATASRDLANVLPEVIGELPARTRGALTEHRYRATRERYARAAAAQGVHYDHASVPASVAQRLRARGLSPRRRGLGEVRTLAFFPDHSWHRQLVPHLRALGPLSWFDYHQHGLTLRQLYERGPDAGRLRDDANEAFVRHAREAARDGGVDWVFVYANGLEILPETVSRVREATGAPVVGMCLDDKQSWEGGPTLGGRPGGQRPLAAAFDLAWTSARVACEWYLLEGGCPVFLPEGCSPELFAPAAVEQDVDLAFVGQAYGFRRRFVERLRRANLRVAARGLGWEDGPLSDQGVVELFQRSKIILGHGGVGWSMTLKNLKGRDFDAPCIGTAAYLTSFNPDLAGSFRAGEEIVMYGELEEAVELARELLADHPRRKRIAAAGRRRCLEEHTWRHRFETVARLLGILA
jgi:hypothetical protein